MRRAASIAGERQGIDLIIVHDAGGALARVDRRGCPEMAV